MREREKEGDGEVEQMVRLEGRETEKRSTVGGFKFPSVGAETQTDTGTGKGDTAQQSDRERESGRAQ